MDAATPQTSAKRRFIPLGIAVLTVSDTRRLADDRSGDTLEQRLTEMKTQLVVYEGLIASPEEQALYARFAPSWNAYLVLHKAAVARSEQGDQAGAILSYNTEMSAAIRQVTDILAELIGKVERDAQVTRTEAQAAAERGMMLLGTISVLALVLSAGAALFLVLAVSRPLGGMTEAMHRLASGDTQTEIPAVGRGDEIGAMAAAVQVVRDNLIHTRQLEADTALARASSEAQRQAGMREMADGFERAVGGIVARVSESAAELQSTASAMTANAGETARQSTAAGSGRASRAARVASV